MSKKVYPFLAVIIIMLFLLMAEVSMAAGAGTLKTNFIRGLNTWDWSGKVVSGPLTDGSMTYSVGSDDVDMVLMSYDDQASVTAELAWSIVVNTGVVTITGDADEEITILIIDFTGF